VQRCRQALFALDYRHPRLVALRAAGGSCCGTQDGALWLSHQGIEHVIASVRQLPITLDGAARFNVANAAAAALAAACLGWSPQAITAALQRFGSDAADNPGRLERWQWRGATVLIDYAHNPDGLAQLLAVARALVPRRLGLLLGQAGNRDDGAIGELAATAAVFAPDRIVIKELPLMLRGRAVGDVPALLRAALQRSGCALDRVVHEPDELRAAQALLAWAQPGDVVVLPVHTGAVRQALAALLAQA
jgi:cyanophycin synthetase